MRQITKKVLKTLLAVIMCFSILHIPSLGTEVHAAAGDVPDHEKTLTVNDDGTYTIALNVTGDSEKKVQKVNVIVIFDTSSSMNEDSGTTAVTYTASNDQGNPRYGLIDGEYVPLERRGNYPNRTYWYNGVQYTGQRYIRTEANQSRLQAAESAVNELANALLSYNGADGNPNDTIEMALVDFANHAEIAQAPTTSYDDFSATVNSRNAGNNNRGTNWEAGLSTALDVDFNDNDPTYVIFVSDGAPTFRDSRNGYTQDWNNTYNVYGSGSESNTDNVTRSYNAATDDAKALVDAGYEFYTIFAYGSALGATRMQDITTASGAPDSNYFSAANTAELQAALAQILEQIEMAGIGAVSMEDGTTSSVTTTTGEISNLLTVDESSYKYYRAGGTENGSEKYDSNANGGLGEEWTDAPAATFEDGAVKWDLKSVGVLENDVTYTVTFDCWPSQTTLDIVADIKNNPSSYGSLDENIKKYIDADGNLKTNTSASISYIDTRTGQQGGDTFENPDPVATSAVEELAITKEWSNAFEDKDKEPITLNVTRDGKNTYTISLNKDNDWKDSVYISIGILRHTTGDEYEILEKGHDFTFTEPKDLGYYWEIEVPVVRPMMIDGTLTMLILKDADHTNPNNAAEYTIDGKTYYVGSTGDAKLTATNHRRSRLNITKVVDGEDADPTQTFPFTINVVDSKASEGSADDLNSDYWVWFSVWNGGYVDCVVSGAEKEMKDGAWTGYYYAPSGTDIVVNLKNGDNLRFLNLPTDSTYTITEGTLPANYTFTSSALTSGTDTSFVGAQTSTGTIAETETDYVVTYTNTYGLSAVEVTKVWVDNNDQDGLRLTPEEFKAKLTLKADGTDVTSQYANNLTVEVDPEDANKYIIKWTDLNRYADGAEITYTVEEATITGYTTTGSPAEDHGTITNSHTPETIDITVTKQWDDKSDQDGVRPTSVTFQLYANGTAVSGKTVTLNKPDGATVNEWTAEFEDVDKYANGEEIVYTIKELKGETALESGAKLDDNYTVTYPANLTAKNSYTPETTSVTVTKAWEDVNNQDGIRPTSVQVQLYADEQELGDPVTLNAGNNWTYTWQDLDKNSAGSAISYTVDEITTSVITGEDGPGTYSYAVTGSQANGYTVTNTHTPEVVSVTVTKVWSDADNQDGIRPDTVTINLLANNSPYTGSPASVVLGENGTWTYTWENLPKYAGTNTAIAYTVEEVTTEVITGTDGAGTYAFAVTGDMASGFTVTNTHTPEKTEATVKKVWDDVDNQDGKRPTSLIVSLSDGQTDGQTVTLNAANNWEATITNLPKYANGTEIVYTWTEEALPDGYTLTNTAKEGTVTTLTNSYAPEKTTVTVTKAWEDVNNQDGIRPTSVQVQLLANGEKFGDPVTLNASGNWTYTWTNLDKMSAGTAIAYTVEEVKTDVITGTDGVGTYAIEVTGSQADGYTVTNTHTPEVTTVTVTKEWVDGNNQDAIRPDSVTINLLANGSAYTGTPASVTLGTDGTWTYTWENLPKYAGTTTAIEYTVEEVKTAVITGTDGPGTYAISITGSQADGFTVTNTHTPEVVTVKVTKSWADGDNQDAIRPDSVTINLLADGKAYTGTPASVTLDEDGNWTYTWTELPKYAGSTTAVAYTVEEVKTDVITGTDGPGTYAISITGSQADGFTVTNTHTPELTERTVTKVWDDADNQDGIRPETLTVTLKNGDTVVGTVILSEENEWTGTIDKLPKYAGTTTEINYVWEETVPADYTKTSQTTEGTVTTITNSHTPAETTVTVTKVWDDADNQDAIRPESVTINLLANGEPYADEEVATVTLNEDGEWTYTWTGLPKYAGSTTPIVYTVTETTTSVITGTDGVGTYAYKIEGDQSKGYTVTNTHTPELTEITVTKIWDDVSNQDGKRPDSVKYQIYADGVAVTGDLATVLVSKPDGDAEDKWTATVKNLPKYAGKTTPIVYTIKELNADGEVIAEGGALDENYTVSYGEDGLTATNKHTPEQTQRTVVKVWDDNNNQDGFRPESLDVQLLADGEVYTTVTLNDENEWTVTVDELDVYKAGKEIVYSWAEQLPTDVDYSMTSSVETTDEELGKVTTITNKHTPEETSVPVTKVWDDAEDQDGLRPESIKVQLMVGENKIGDPVELSEENDWSYIWTELDKRADGEIIKYEVVEVEVPEGYEVTIENTAAEGSFSYTVTNTHETEDTEVPVTKVWDDAEDQDGIRPESIIAVLVKDGVDYMEIELNEENEWTYTWKELDKYRDHGTEIVYTVKEKATPEGYEASVEGNTITNTHTPAEVEVSVEKVWDDADNQDGIRPEKIKVNLLADGEVIDSYELVEAEEWKHTFSELPKYKIENGKGGIEIKYTVEEAEVPEGYEMTQEGNTITNTHTPEEVSVTVEKVWEDDDNNDGFRPESITVYLLADGEKIRQLTLSEENDWTETVEGLPKFKVGAVGKEVEYKFEEDPVAEYEVTYSDINEGKIVITNTHENELIDIPVEKVWVGDEDFQVIRPEKITVVLLADGKEAGTAELSYDNEWKYTFEELEKYADGKEIAYTVKEVEVPAGYKSEITGSKEDGYKVTNTFTPIHFDPPVMKTVKGDEADSGDTFTFQFEGLDGAPMPEGAEGQIMTATLKAGEEHEFGNVYLIEPGTYQYKITEVNDGKEGYTYDETEYLLVFEITVDEDNQLAVKLTINGEEADYQNLTPTQFEFVNEYREYVDVEVEKIWDDKDNAEGKRPEEIKVTLYANNEAVETVTLNEENGWTYKWEGLAFSDEEYEEISYTVKEDEVPEGYTMSFSQTGYKVTITNTVNPPETGDTNNLKLWATLMALSMTSSVALAGVALKRRKEDELF